VRTSIGISITGSSRGITSRHASTGSDERTRLGTIRAALRAAFTGPLYDAADDAHTMTFGRRRLRVLTIVDCLMTSGAEILATQIAAGLDTGRFESIVCSTRPSAPEHVAALRGQGTEVLELGRRSKLDVWRWWPLVRLLRSGRVDIVHAHKFGSNLWAAVLSPLADVPVLLAHEHTWSFAGQPLRRIVDREVITRASTAFLAVSESDRRKMIEIEGIPAEKIRFVPNGIPDQPPGDRRRARAELGIPPDAPVVGTVCALRPQKAVEIALAAVARLATEQPEVRFVVVGDGPERPRLERDAERLGVRVHFLGRRPNTEIPDLVAAMDVVVSSSRFEGTPLAVLEWMAAGRAIVATDVGGVPALIDDGVEGVLVPPLDAATLSAAIARLLGDPIERERLGSAARLRQQKEFRLEHTLDILQALYETLYWTSPHGLREQSAGRGPARSEPPR
jgi:glycosyltransferase involved in cell wall biosynthesis